MKEATRAALAELQAVDWFARVGTRACLPGRPEPLWADSWPVACRIADTLDSVSARTEVSNSLGAAVQSASWEAYCRWNDLVRGVKPATEELADRVVAPAGKAHGVPGLASPLVGLVLGQRRMAKTVLDCVKCDVLLYLVELEYSDLVKPAALHEEMEWYRSGQFPCGWQGEWPEGRRVVF